MKYSIIILLLMSFASCSSPKARKPISRTNSTTFIEKSIKRNKALIKLEETLFERIIAKDTSHTYITSPNGFWYYYNQKINQEGAKPKVGDEVIFNYEIRDVKNNIIYKKEELGSRNQVEKEDRILKIDGEEFITGMHEGLKLMKQGEKVTFLFPSNKVFGVTGFQDRITPNQSLIIEVLLKKINQNNNQNKTN